LGASFGDLQSWENWITVLKAAFGQQLTHDEIQAFEAVAGSRKPPAQKVRELWVLLGRRGGKSRVAGAVAAYIAALVDHSAKLVPGETGYVLVLAATKDQARVITGYAEGFLKASKLLSNLVSEVTADEIRLENNVTIAVHPANFRTIRGRTLLAAIFDEIAFWRSEESAQPDLEIYRAVLPTLSTTNGMLVAISSPIEKSGCCSTSTATTSGRIMTACWSSEVPASNSIPRWPLTSSSGPGLKTPSRPLPNGMANSETT
jgi:hypothetical protein